MSNDYTNPKILTALTWLISTLTSHGLVNKFFSAIPSRKTSMPANMLCTPTEICVQYLH